MSRYAALLALLLTLFGWNLRAQLPAHADSRDVYYTGSLRCDTVHHYYVYWVEQFDPDIYPYFPVNQYPQYAGGWC